jgi:hypothetical protein
LGRPRPSGIDIEMAFGPAVAAVNLEQLPLPDQVADRHWLAPERLGLAPALGLIPLALQLDQLRQA